MLQYHTKYREHTHHTWGLVVFKTSINNSKIYKIWSFIIRMTNDAQEIAEEEGVICYLW